MNLKRELLHRIDVTPCASLDAYGDKTMGTTVQSVQCFITGSDKRVLNAQGEILQVGYDIMFLPTATIGLDYLVSNGVNRFGTTLIHSARVVSYEPVDHPKKGLDHITVWVVVGE